MTETLVTDPSLIDRAELARVWKGAPLSEIDPGDADTFDNALLAYLRGRTSPHFFFHHADAARLGAEIAAQRPEQAQWIIDRADCTLAHRLPAADQLFDAYVVQLPERIDWYHNPTDEPHFPHTINRHRFWWELAMASRFTGDGRYIDELQRQIVSWCEQTPPPTEFPEAWQEFPRCWFLLDAAIRADTWVWALFLALDAPGWQPAINTLVIHRLWLHARILKHLTPRSGTNWAPNWLIMQAQGLLNIAVMFPEFEEAAEWREHAADVLRLCAQSQFFEDGGHCEQSPVYHEACLRWLAEPLYLARINGHGGADDSWSIIEKASDFAYRMMTPGGTLPALSDSDRTSGGMLTQMGLFFKRPEWMRYREPAARDCWFLGGIPSGQGKAADARALAVRFPDAGYFVMRSGDSPDSVQLVFDCGVHGGGHGHFDLLGFDLYGFGRPLIADPGRLVYDNSDDRHWLVGTASHNTICLDGQNHQPIDRDRAALLHVEKWDVEPSHMVVSAWHEAYGALAGAPRVGRTIWFDRRSIFVIVDWVLSAADHDISVSYTVPGERFETLPGGGIRTAAGGIVQAEPTLLSGQAAEIVSAFYSPDYGVRLAANRLIVTQRARRSVFVTIVQAAQSEAELRKIDDGWISVDDATGTVRLGGAQGREEIRLTPPFPY